MIYPSLNYVHKDPSDNESPVMAWHQKGAKSLPEPMMTQIADAYMSTDFNELNNKKPKNNGKYKGNQWLIDGCIGIEK